jgi:hypothetical protein
LGLRPSFGLRPKDIGHSPRRTPGGRAEANTPGKDATVHE